ncbi:MAG: hypothetical protein IT458_05985 [Planctomycetes bacterium]|nr:hypothetical protein [Planctomycetota bacterium]
MIPALLALALALPQDPPPAPAVALAEFLSLPADVQAQLVDQLEARLAALELPAAQRIRALAGKPETGWAVAEPAPIHDPAVWAKDVAPPRTLLRADDERHARVRAKVPSLAFLPDLAWQVRYDWAKAAIVRRADPLGLEERFANACHGYLPGSDRAAARVLAALDQDPAQRKLGAYFAHLYADLDARVFDGITLHEVWASGQQLDVPDVDAIPFAVLILNDRSYRSPIPANARRSRLYEQIKRQAFLHRRHRGQLEAAAGAALRAEPAMDPVYALMVPRFHFLWSQGGDDPLALRKILAGSKDRDALLDKVDQQIRTQPEAFQRRESRRDELAALERRVRELAAEALRAAKAR